MAKAAAINMANIRFFVGAAFFAAMLYISVFVKPIDVWLFGIPAALMNGSLREFATKIVGRK